MACCKPRKWTPFALSHFTRGAVVVHDHDLRKTKKRGHLAGWSRIERPRCTPNIVSFTLLKNRTLEPRRKQLSEPLLQAPRYLDL